ncbi:MAG TPA: YfiR family protein [Bacteroidia bacterium]|jgi:hypothetical protein|nr:YfiR family protein [Bacteroidia bacterium]
MRKRILTYQVAFAILGCIFFKPVQIRAQSLNYQLASVFVYNFIQSVEWPKDKRSGSFVIGVYGSSPLTAELVKFITSKHVGDQPIIVKVITSLDNAADCHVIFVPLDQSDKIKQICLQLKGKPILIIAEKIGLCKKGASISLFLDEDDDYKTKFELNRAIIESNGLSISERLILLASQMNK